MLKLKLHNFGHLIQRVDSEKPPVLGKIDSTDGTSWSNMKTSTIINLSSGQTVFVRGTLTSDNASYTYTQFKMNGNLSVKGNINYLWNYSNPNAALKQYCGFNLFASCTALTDVSELKLPATTLANHCYNSMFSGCTSLTSAPELPATTLKSNCYSNMFYGCTSLTSAPELPATTLTNSCYSYMFTLCRNLNYIKCLATNASFSYTLSWLLSASSTGDFYKASGANWETGVGGIPSGWTVHEV